MICLALLVLVRAGLLGSPGASAKPPGCPPGGSSMPTRAAGDAVEKPLYDPASEPDRQTGLPGGTGRGVHPGGGEKRLCPDRAVREPPPPTGGLLPAGGAHLCESARLTASCTTATAPSRSITPRSWKAPAGYCWMRCASRNGRARRPARMRSRRAARAAGTERSAIRSYKADYPGYFIFSAFQGRRCI